MGVLDAWTATAALIKTLWTGIFGGQSVEGHETEVRAGELRTAYRAAMDRGDVGAANAALAELDELRRQAEARAARR